MTIKDISPNNIRIGGYAVLFSIVGFFGVQLVNKLGAVSDKVDFIQINAAARDQKLNDLSDKVVGIDQNVTKILFHWQKETAAQGDETYNRFGTLPKYANKFVDP